MRGVAQKSRSAFHSRTGSITDGLEVAQIAIASGKHVRAGQEHEWQIGGDELLNAIVRGLPRLRVQRGHLRRHQAIDFYLPGVEGLPRCVR